MKYKLIKDGGHGKSKQVMYETDDMLEIAEFCRAKAGGPAMDLGLDFGRDDDDGGPLL